MSYLPHLLVWVAVPFITILLIFILYYGFRIFEFAVTDVGATMRPIASNAEFFLALKGLIYSWCDRRALNPLARVLGPYVAFRAGSTGRRNTSVKSLCWGFKSQGLALPLVELACHFVQMGL